MKIVPQSKNKTRAQLHKNITNDNSRKCPEQIHNEVSSKLSNTLFAWK